MDGVNIVPRIKTKPTILCTTESYISKQANSHSCLECRDSRVKSAFFIYVANNIVGISFKKRITAF